MSDFVTITVFGYWTTQISNQDGSVKKESTLVHTFDPKTCIHHTEDGDGAYVKVQGVKGEYSRQNFHRAATRKPRTCSIFRKDFASPKTCEWLTKYKRGTAMDLEHNEWYYGNNRGTNSGIDLDTL